MAFGQRCEQAGVRPSTGRTGSCFDNAITESFFASLECELIDRRTFRTRSEAERAVFAYIEGFYNLRRRRSANGQLSPAEYERDQALKPIHEDDYAAAWSKALMCLPNPGQLQSPQLIVARRR